MFVFWVTFQERLAHLKRQCQPHLTETAKSSVEGICSKMYNISCESVRKIHEFHWQLLKEHGIKGQQILFEIYALTFKSNNFIWVIFHHITCIKNMYKCSKHYFLSRTIHVSTFRLRVQIFLTEPAKFPDPINPRKVLCYPIQMCVPCPRLQTVELMQDKETHTLKCNGEILKINSSHFCKLVNIYISVSTLYEHACMIRKSNTIYYTICQYTYAVCNVSGTVIQIELSR